MDGTKVRANASKDRTYDAGGLRRLLGRLEGAIDELEAQNEAGEEPASGHLPETLHDRKVLREQVRETMSKLAGREGQKHINLTDQDARMMKTRQGFAVAYNAQAMVSEVDVDGKAAGMLITAADVVDEPSDRPQLGPMMDKAEETLGHRAEVTLADAGYHSGSNLEQCATRGRRVVMPESQNRALESPYHKDRFVYDEESDSYLCPEGQLLRFTRIKRTRGTMMRVYRASGAVCRACPAFGVCTKDRRHGRALEVGPHDATWTKPPAPGCLRPRATASLSTEDATGPRPVSGTNQGAAASPQVSLAWLRPPDSAESTTPSLRASNILRILMAGMPRLQRSW